MAGVVLLPLADRVVLVTGGGRGIGRAIVKHAVRAGARVATCARSFSPKPEVHGNVLSLRCNVSDPASINTMFETVERILGAPDVVINNAGTSAADLLISTSIAEWNRVVSVNATAPYRVAERAIASFGIRGGTILNVGSLAHHGSPSNACYAASKGALAGLTDWLASTTHVAPVRSHLLVVGLVETELTQELPPLMRERLVEQSPLRRACDEGEVAQAALSLCTPNVPLQNGAHVYVSCGLQSIPG